MTGCGTASEGLTPWGFTEMCNILIGILKPQPFKQNVPSILITRHLTSTVAPSWQVEETVSGLQSAWIMALAGLRGTITQMLGYIAVADRALLAIHWNPKKWQIMFSNASEAFVSKGLIENIPYTSWIIVIYDKHIWSLHQRYFTQTIMESWHGNAFLMIRCLQREIHVKTVNNVEHRFFSEQVNEQTVVLSVISAAISLM